MRLIILISCFTLYLAAPTAAIAACSNPTGEEADIVYNADYHVAQFCNGTNWISMAAGVAELKWNSDGTNVYYDGGNVGIGTTSPSEELDIIKNQDAATMARISNTDSGTAATAAFQATNGTGLVSLQVLGSGYSPTGVAQPGTALLGAYNAIPLAIQTNGILQFASGGVAERMRIDASGNVGIGTPSPLGPLHVALGLNDAGSARFYAPLSSDGQFSQIRLGYGDGSFQSVGLRFIRYATGNELAFFHWGEGGGIHLKQGGKVGIGISDPGAPLEVPAGAGGGTAILCGRGNGSSNCHIDAYNPGSGTRGIYLNYFTGTGVYLAGGAAVTSDLRKKRDIETLPNALDKIAAIRGVSYHWKDPERDQSAKLGVIAQEVEKVFPEVVKDDGYGFLTVEYSALVGPIIEAIKELKAENDNLRAMVEEQGREIEELKADAR